MNPMRPLSYMVSMRPLKLVAVLALACVALAHDAGRAIAQQPVAAQQRVMLDEAAIIVNNRIMTRREVASVRELQLKDLQQRFKGKDLERETQALSERLPNQLVDNLLIEARAEELAITVSDKEIDQRMESIVRRDPSVMDIYTEAQLKDYIYKDSLRRTVVQREVGARVRVEDDEIKRACRQETRDNREVDVGHILIRDHDAKSADRLRAIRKQLVDGADFEQLAQTYSQDPSVTTNHGRLGYVSRGQFVKEFEDKAFSLQPGQVSDPVETQFGWHLIKVFGERTKANINCDALDDANRQRIYNRLYSQATDKRLQEYMADLRKRADIVVNMQ
jgi:foldase protein PrsA